MNYGSVIMGQHIVDSIPFEMDGKKLSVAMTAQLAVIQASYKMCLKSVDDLTTEVIKRLKKEGFDERAQKILRMEAIDKKRQAHLAWKEGDEGERPEAPTDEEIAEADKIREGKEAYDKEFAELDTAYKEAYDEKLKEEVKEPPKRMSGELFEAVIEMLGVSGKMTASTPGGKMEVNRADFIRLMAETLLY